MARWIAGRAFAALSFVLLAAAPCPALNITCYASLTAASLGTEVVRAADEPGRADGVRIRPVT